MVPKIDKKKSDELSHSGVINFGVRLQITEIRSENRKTETITTSKSTVSSFLPSKNWLDAEYFTLLTSSNNLTSLKLKPKWSHLRDNDFETVEDNQFVGKFGKERQLLFLLFIYLFFSLFVCIFSFWISFLKEGIQTFERTRSQLETMSHMSQTFKASTWTYVFTLIKFNSLLQLVMNEVIFHNSSYWMEHIKDISGNTCQRPVT